MHLDWNRGWDIHVAAIDFAPFHLVYIFIFLIFSLSLGHFLPCSKGDAQILEPVQPALSKSVRI